MTDASWHHPRADQDGFVALEEIQDRARRLSREDFLREFPVPALLVVYRDSDGSKGGQALDPSDHGVQLLTVSIKSASVLRYLNRLAFLCKRPGNPYAHLISVGRSHNNDITIAVDSVSKVHGYFATEDGRWNFTDHSSTNGSLINDHELRSGQKHILQDGDVLQLGLEVTLEYHGSGSLYDRARRR